MSGSALTLAGLLHQYDGGGGFTLRCPEFSVAAGESVLLLGESGSGKSTLLSLICGILAPKEGRIDIAATELSKLRPAARDAFRAEHIGVIFQQFNLLPYASAQDNVLLPLHFSSARRARVTDPPARARALLAALGLPEGTAAVAARHLSVGQQQRVAVARALIGAPELIVADEPTSALDATTQGTFLDLLFDQCRAAGSALLMVSHDPRIGSRFDRVVELADIVTTERAAAA
ncbi:ABC transporter ATP-binding protein [Pseudoroseicyclus tamaricis]|uniref:ABC transporter ATP-binding protein n=1 Tax=Pseudoroseicyclus tamaricis TaxID=2705421 RepID=A0A6B2JXW0_9RHOB|nr:ABC transporter ATP-binding protein [Pseudoroseicyclus tamaricis]NDV01114.1 ABC transporter ATP-binding protein [Pseudoroseicyclus tamaricis]